MNIAEEIDRRAAQIKDISLNTRKKRDGSLPQDKTRQIEHLQKEIDQLKRWQGACQSEERGDSDALVS